MLALIFIFLLALAPAVRAEVVLVRDGKPAARIVLPEKPTPTERLAAEELRDHIRLMTGAELPLGGEPGKAEARILIGRAAAAAGLTADGLEPEHYRIKTGPGWLAIAGRDGSLSDRVDDPLELSTVQVGTLFGVYHLLDQVLGVRWLWPGELGMFAPRRAAVVIPDLDLTGGPKLVQRSIRSPRSSKRARAKFLKVDGVSALPEDLAERQGREERLWLRRHRMGRRMRFGFGHAFTRWWDKYHETHPEFFARLHGHEQPYPAPDRVKFCVSNPAVVEQIVKDWQAAGAPDSLRACPNDSRAYCTCERCRAWDLPVKTTPENVDESVLTYRYVRFWNALAEKAVAVNPKVWVCGYAYSNYRRPPEGVKLRGNIILGFVPGSTSVPRAAALYDIEKDWQGWSKAGASLFLRPNWWHAGHLAPYLPLHDAGRFFKFAFEHKMQGTDFDSLLGHWATQGPYYYLVARLHARPGLSVDAVIGEYCSAFGPAAPAVRDYLDYWENFTVEYARQSIARADDLGGVNRAQIRLLPALFTDDVLSKAGAILARAAELAGDDVRCRKRVEFLRLGLEHVRLTRDAVRWADGAVSYRGAKNTPEVVRAAAALRNFRRSHAASGFDWTEYSDYNEIRLGDFTGLRLTHALGGRTPLAVLPAVWFFQWDPQNVGERERWFAADFDHRRRKWLRAQVFKAWEQQDVGKAWAREHDGKDYDGVAWYRTSFDVPAEARGKKVSLLFGAVDESCKVWINGELVGEHPFVKPDDWKTPFEIDISRAVRFGRPNVVAVRVEDNAGLGGVWRLVWLLAE